MRFWEWGLPQTDFALSIDVRRWQVKERRFGGCWLLFDGKYGVFPTQAKEDQARQRNMIVTAVGNRSPTARWHINANPHLTAAVPPKQGVSWQ